MVGKFRSSIGDFGWRDILDSGGLRGPTPTCEVYEISKSNDFMCDFWFQQWFHTDRGFFQGQFCHGWFLLWFLGQFCDFSRWCTRFHLCQTLFSRAMRLVTCMSQSLYSIEKGKFWFHVISTDDVRDFSCVGPLLDRFIWQGSLIEWGDFQVMLHFGTLLLLGMDPSWDSESARLVGSRGLLQAVS